MFSEIGQKALQNGETVNCAKVSGPDLEWVERLVPFLSHKSGIWVRRIERTLKEPLPPLVPNHYILCSAGEVVANICIYSVGKVGLLGHVFTKPANRRWQAWRLARSNASARLSKQANRVGGLP